MIDVSEYVKYLPEQQALICRGCKYCLQPNGVEGHLGRTHTAVKLEVRKELVSYAEKLTLRNPSEIMTPITAIPAFDDLRITRGFRCAFCDGLYGTPGNIKEHCKSHNWPKPEGTSYNRIG